MRLKIVNETDWSTKDLRKILRVAAKTVHVRQDKVVHIQHRRQRFTNDLAVSGRAYVGSRSREARSSKLFIPSKKHFRKAIVFHIDLLVSALHGSGCSIRYLAHFPKELHEICDRFEQLPEAIAAVACHEFMHNLGARHTHMTREQNCCEHKGIAVGLVLTPKFETPKEKESAKERGIRLTEKRAAHAEAMLKRAVTRRKRAQTLEKKWREKVRYYERKQAAKNGEDNERKRVSDTRDR